MSNYFSFFLFWYLTEAGGQDVYAELAGREMEVQCVEEITAEVKVVANLPTSALSRDTQKTILR